MARRIARIKTTELSRLDTEFGFRLADYGLEYEDNGMNTNAFLNPQAADAFAEDVREILLRSTPEFDLKGVAKLGLDRGLITRLEADQIALYSNLPDWLATRLDDGVRRLQTRARSTRLVTSQAWTLTAPGGDRPKGALLADLTPEEGASPAMHRIEGGASVHHLANFRKISWVGDQILSNMSDARGAVFLPFLEAAEPVHLDGHTLLATVEGSKVYTHWMLDTLPRLLLLLEEDPKALDGIDNFLFATVRSSFHEQTLDKLGIDRARIVTRQHNGTLFSVDSFTHVTRPRKGFLTDKRVYDAVAGLFLPDFAPRPQTRRLHISRARAGRRRILNEGELLPLLEANGFETLYLEDMSIAETAAAMREASHVIATHGAGLSNLIFAQEGTNLLELFNAHLSREYWVICNQLGIDYTGFKAQNPEGRYLPDDERRQMTFFDRNGQDLIIPMEDFRPVLEAFLAG